MDKSVRLRVHHFYDVIRDFGVGKKIEPHPDGHSFHRIAQLIRSNPKLKIKIVVDYDSICDGCSHLKGGHCDDVVNHRKDFKLKEEFNNYVDRRIMDRCQIKEGEILTPFQLCQKAKCYLDNIGLVYLGNDEWHTKGRKKNVNKGLKYYSQLHGFSFDPGK
ncbi:DUF1284 domain-containing protein [Patescibacteria group bacterium]